MNKKHLIGELKVLVHYLEMVAIMHEDHYRIDFPNEEDHTDYLIRGFMETLNTAINYIEEHK